GRRSPRGREHGGDEPAAPPRKESEAMIRSRASRLLARWSVLCLLGLPRGAAAQTPAPDPADVGTIEGIVHAYFVVINGPPRTPRQWRRDSTLCMPAATFVSMD